MKLLVSVRSAAEVAAALVGGADIIDAKEPSLGSLGPVSSLVLSDILAHVPEEQAVSIALGDFRTPSEVVGAFASQQLPERAAPVYCKLGFAGVRAPDRIEAMVSAAVSAAHRLQPAAAVVVAAYADFSRAETAPPDTISRIAAECGATGVLLDTQVKDGRGLLMWWDLSALQPWVERARNAGLLTALAGGLRLPDIDRVSRAEPDVVGVRGAACDGGRSGKVSVDRVRALRRRLDQPSGFVQGATMDGETRDPGAISPCQELA